jgi:hypothetical protein
MDDILRSNPLVQKAVTQFTRRDPRPRRDKIRRKAELEQFITHGVIALPLIVPFFTNI